MPTKKHRRDDRNGKSLLPTTVVVLDFKREPLVDTKTIGRKIGEGTHTAQSVTSQVTY